MSDFDNSDSRSTNQDGSLKPNTILVARYRIEEMLGGGSNTLIYKARDLNFPDANRFVAVKETRYPTDDVKRRSVMMKSFQREVNVLASAAYPTIPHVHDFFGQAGRDYLVMEYIDGVDLQTVLNEIGDMPVEKVVEWGIALCETLHYLHTLSPEPVIHRDICPTNILIDHLGRLRLIGFSFARFWHPNDKHRIAGTQGYAAPEVYNGQAAPSSDIYSLGVLLHQILTQTDPRLEPPFSYVERPIEKYNAESPADLNRVVFKALAYEPEQRFASAFDMKLALESVQSELPENPPADFDLPPRSKPTTLPEDFIEGVIVVRPTLSRMADAPPFNLHRLYMTDHDHSRR